jgi:integrase
MPRPNKGPKLELNESNVYEIRWSEKGRSKRVSTRTGNLQEAQRFFAGWILEAETARVAATTFNLRRILGDYTREHVEEQVIDQRRIQDCLRPIEAEFGDLMPCDLTSDRIAAYKQKRRNGELGRKVQDSTIRRELVALVAALNHAVKQRRLEGRDVPHIAMPPNPPSRDFWLNEREESAFLGLAAQTSGDRLSRIHRFVAIALDTAARRKSIETLKWDQVDLSAGVIHYESNGKRQKNKRRVPVPISDRLRTLLERAYNERTSEYVLDTPYSVQHHFDALTARACKEIGQKFSYLTIHDLRRTWATLAARAGVNLFQIAGVLGDTMATVERAYAHHCPDHLRAAVNFR